MYLNSFYFAMFGACQCGISILKAVNLSYDSNILRQEMALLLGMIIVESVRIYFGRHGSLSDRGKRGLQVVKINVASWIISVANGNNYFHNCLRI